MLAAGSAARTRDRRSFAFGSAINRDSSVFSQVEFHLGPTGLASINL
jgi:hypothetical protein